MGRRRLHGSNLPGSQTRMEHQIHLCRTRRIQVCARFPFSSSIQTLLSPSSGPPSNPPFILPPPPTQYNLNPQLTLELQKEPTGPAAPWNFPPKGIQLTRTSTRANSWANATARKPEIRKRGRELCTSLRLWRSRH